MPLNIYINKNKLIRFNTLNIFLMCRCVNITIPRFCFSEFLDISGNCRMCLIGIKNRSVFVAACTLKLSNNVQLLIDNPAIKKAREDVLNLLLINHPLDCPICDQGGKCDLQDLNLIFGNCKGGFSEVKKTAGNIKNNFYIKTAMSRCILCMKCTRFFNVFYKNAVNFGIISRGGEMAVGFYRKDAFLPGNSANITDLCPVGFVFSFFKGSSFFSVVGLGYIKNFLYSPCVIIFISLGLCIFIPFFCVSTVTLTDLMLLFRDPLFLFLGNNLYFKILDIYYSVCLALEPLFSVKFKNFSEAGRLIESCSDTTDAIDIDKTNTEVPQNEKSWLSRNYKTIIILACAGSAVFFLYLLVGGGTFGTSGTSNVPATSATSDNFVTPRTSNVPATPATSDTSDNFVTPRTSNVPATPDISDIPDVSDILGSLGIAIPDTSNVPATPATPDTSNVPATPATPDTSNVPATPATPATPDTSNAPGISSDAVSDVASDVSDVSDFLDDSIELNMRRDPNQTITDEERATPWGRFL